MNNKRMNWLHPFLVLTPFQVLLTSTPVEFPSRHGREAFRNWNFLADIVWRLSASGISSQTLSGDFPQLELARRHGREGLHHGGIDQKSLFLAQILFMNHAFAFLASCLILWSCARVGSPGGGARDTLAPKLLSSNIDSPRVNVPRTLKTLKLNFDEYITLKDINKELMISPPIKRIKKILPSNLANQYILIQWEDMLEENTTYSFNFGNAILDNNEKNILPYFTYVFSTGSKTDSLYISGTVQDVLATKNSPKKEKPILVGLYKVQEKMDYKQKPDYLTKTDEEHYFILNYLAAGNYHLLAFEDENQNSVYDEGKEKVAFIKETIELNKNLSGLKLQLFPSKKTVKYKETKTNPGGITLFFEGNPQQVQVKSLDEVLKDYKVTHKKTSDSVQVWFDAKTNHLDENTGTQLRFEYQTENKKDTIGVFYRKDPKEEFSISNTKGNLLPPEQSFVITANMPIRNLSSEKWRLEADSTAQGFTARISEEDPKKLLVSSDFMEGKKYSLSVPRESLSSDFHSLSKSYIFNFETDVPQNYGSFTLKLTHPPKNQFWIQLLNERNEVQYSQLTNEAVVLFKHLKPSPYRLRILVDENGNGVWDTTDFSKKTFAEAVYLFPKVIHVRQLWEIVEEWDLKQDKE